MSKSDLTNYFLGTLADESAAEVELRVMDDAEFAGEVAHAEEELVDAYLDGHLTPADELLFRTKYLTTNERVVNLEIVRLLKLHAREGPANQIESKAPVAPKRQGYFGWLAAMRPIPKFATAFAVLIAFAATAWWLTRPRSNDDLLALQNRYELLNQTPGSVGLDANVSELTLVPGNLRGAVSGTALSLTGLTENVRLRIALPPGGEIATNYGVTLFRDNAEVFRLTNIRPLTGPGGAELRLLLPREILDRGNYRINLQPEKLPPLTYAFAVKD